MCSFLLFLVAIVFRMKFFLLVLLLTAFSFSLVGSELRIATFNVRYDAKGDQGPRDWKARRDLVSETIREMNPSLLGLQEVVHGQLEDLKDAHPEYEVVGVARDDGKQRGEYSPLFFRKDRFRLDEKENGTFWLSDTPQVVGSNSWGNACTRICTWARLIDRKTEKGIYVLNTHWDHKGQWSRVKSATLIRQRIASIANQGEAVVLMGDFNASESSLAIKELLAGEQVKIVNSFHFANSEEVVRGTFNGWRVDATQGKMIDHIFVNSNLAVKSARIVRRHRKGQTPSDHFPVLTICEW